MCLDGTCVGAVVIVAPGGAYKSWGRLVRRVVNDSHTIFGVFASKLGDEREVAGTVDVGLDLQNELRERECSGVSGVVIAVQDDVDDDVM